jgi:hypothetical protein
MQEFKQVVITFAVTLAFWILASIGFGIFCAVLVMVIQFFAELF